MTPEQARDLQHEMRLLAARLRQGHAEALDVLTLAMTLEEVLAHMAAALEARAKIPRKV